MEDGRSAGMRVAAIAPLIPFRIRAMLNNTRREVDQALMALL